ncbi:laccase [Brachybacterium ginsengisoli]|uniref:Purine nucleoside phosphorylase n=1 Tax=Brachybacterium ginsengisoli TaxID=1331682 RepID=A0A291GYP4_9MICO|nr:peptidoglycan editing factor PgeF [Brachybacterium ginsengisoli]ATG55313.1 laccase [Brachybacterium ginsengisoli]
MSASLCERAPRLRGARSLFTGRSGGVSIGDHAGLNLARHVGDDELSVEHNRALLAEEVGVPVIFVNQVHSADVHVLPETGQSAIVTADAMVTDRRDVALGIMVADCLPVLLSDPRAGVVAVAHAGRQGLLTGVLQNTVSAMVRLGARPEDLEASIGPAICGACYEVPAAMRGEAAEILPETWATTSWGTPSLDLRAGAAAVLEAAGVPRAAIDAEHPCTLEDERFYSYRRAARTGRFAGVIRRA